MHRPDQLPDAITGPAAWMGADMSGRQDEWLIQLSERDIADLERASNHYLSLGRDVGEITAEDFPLETFGAHLELMKEKISCCLNGDDPAFFGVSHSNSQ